MTLAQWGHFLLFEKVYKSCKKGQISKAFIVTLKLGI
jgi:hypothetical protein